VSEQTFDPTRSGVVKRGSVEYLVWEGEWWSPPRGGASQDYRRIVFVVPLSGGSDGGNPVPGALQGFIFDDHRPLYSFEARRALDAAHGEGGRGWSGAVRFTRVEQVYWGLCIDWAWWTPRCVRPWGPAAAKATMDARLGSPGWRRDPVSGQAFSIRGSRVGWLSSRKEIAEDVLAGNGLEFSDSTLQLKTSKSPAGWP
jgi:hypothetical protein